MSKTKKFKPGNMVQFTKNWFDKVTPNFGVVDHKPSNNKNCIWVKFDVPSPPANVLLVPIDQLELVDEGE